MRSEPSPFFLPAAACLSLVWGACAIAIAQGEPPRPVPARPNVPSASSPASETELPPTGPGAGDAVPADPDDEEVETSLLLIDGTRATGVLAERTPEKIVLVNNGIRRSYATDSVAHIDTLPPVIDRYRQMRTAIGDNDLDQRLLLAQWLRSHRKYQLALDEVSGVLGHDPRNAEALRLRTWLEQQLRLRSRSVERVAPGGPAPLAAPARPRADLDFPTLTPEQINLIRVFEVDLADPPRMMIDRDAITALINRYASDALIPATREGREALYRKPPSQILDLMFRVRARDFYGSVQVMSDPRSMKMFRERVHGTWLLNSCATSRCHGGEGAGRLFLTTRQPNSDATVYTNFLILDRFRLADPRAQGGAAPDDGGKPLIDYDDPARSPLLQLALNRAGSLYPHPEIPVAGGRTKPISPVFLTSNDRRFQDAVEWIRSMYVPRPEYPVEFTPPVPQGPEHAVFGEGRQRKADPISGKR